MRTTKAGATILALARATRHPAFLFSAGNTALAFGQAEPVAISLSMTLTVIIFGTRFAEIVRKHSHGVPFSILAAVNVVTAISVEFNRGIGSLGRHQFAEGLRHVNYNSLGSAIAKFDVHNLLHTNDAVIAAHVSALAYLSWAIGHIFASKHEKNNSLAEKPAENPQTYYGIGDMAAVNAAGSINPLSFLTGNWPGAHPARSKSLHGSIYRPNQ